MLNISPQLSGLTSAPQSGWMKNKPGLELTKLFCLVQQSHLVKLKGFFFFFFFKGKSMNEGEKQALEKENS